MFFDVFCQGQNDEICRQFVQVQDVETRRLEPQKLGFSSAVELHRTLPPGLGSHVNFRKEAPGGLVFSGRGQKPLVFVRPKFFPQQRKLMGSSAQISSGVRRRGSKERVPEEGSRRFRRVPGCAGVGSGGRFRKVPEGSGGFRCRFRKVLEGSGMCWCRFRLSPVPEGSRGFRCVLVSVPDATSGRFRKVPESVVCYLATLTGAAMWLFLNTFWWWHCPHGQNHCRTRMCPCS